MNQQEVNKEKITVEQQLWNKLEILKHHNYILKLEIQNINREMRVLKDRTKTYTDFSPCHVNRPGAAITIYQWCDRCTNDMAPLVLCRKISVVQVMP